MNSLSVPTRNKHVSFQKVEESHSFKGKVGSGEGYIYVSKPLNDEFVALVEKGIRIKALAYGNSSYSEWFVDVDILIENLVFKKERDCEKNDVKYAIRYNLPQLQSMKLSSRYTNFKITQEAHW